MCNCFSLFTTCVNSKLPSGAWFCCWCCCVLCCHVVKLGKATKTDPTNTPKKWKYFRICLQDKLWLHVPKLLFFWLFCCFFFQFAQKHYKIVFETFDMLIFSLCGQNFKVNNVATSRSITWPHFWQTFWKNVAKLLTLRFSHVFLLKLFCHKTHCPCR